MNEAGKMSEKEMSQITNTAIVFVDDVDRVHVHVCNVEYISKTFRKWSI